MKLVLKYGGLVAVGSFAWLLMEYFLGYRTAKFDVHLVTSLFSVVVLLTGVILAIRARKGQLGTAFRFRYGFVTGLGVSLVAGFLMLFGQYIYFGIIDPDYADRAKAWGTYVLVLDGQSLEEAKASTEEGAWKHNIHVRAFGQIPLFLVQGAIISAITSAVVARKR